MVKRWLMGWVSGSGALKAPFSGEWGIAGSLRNGAFKAHSQQGRRESKWPPELELHRPRRVFSALLICLSYLAMDKKWSDTPVLRRASPDSKSGGFAGSLASEI